MLLLKTYADYEIEMRTDLRICSILGLTILPGKSTIQRFMQELSMSNLWEFNRMLLRDFLVQKINLALDASGMRIVGRSIWYCFRIKKKISRSEFDKVHIAIGIDVLFVFNWRISDGKRHDSPFFRLLLASFAMLGLVLADLGYSSRANVQIIADKEGAAFIPFKSNATGKSKIIHNVVIADERGFNYPIERLHNTIRERTKTIRGFHGCIESAHAIMKGLEINYNFNIKHMSLSKKTPAEVAIPQLELGVNKWLDLIKLSKFMHHSSNKQ
jgi:hypothetical protein